MTILQLLLTLFMLIIGVSVYFVPSFVAFARGYKNKVPLLIINLFLGWTGVFWVFTLAWAFWDLDGGLLSSKPDAANGDGAAEKKPKSLVGILLAILGVFVLSVLLLIWISLAPVAPTSIDQSSSSAGAPAATSSGVPMSADDFLNAQ